MLAVKRVMFYKKVNKVRKGKYNIFQVTRHMDGAVLVNEVSSKWKNYFDRLLNNT